MVGVTGLTELSSSDELVQLAAEKLDSVYGDMFMGGLDNPEGIKFQLPLLIDFEFSLTVIPVKEGVAKGSEKKGTTKAQSTQRFFRACLSSLQFNQESQVYP